MNGVSVDLVVVDEPFVVWWPDDCPHTLPGEGGARCCVRTIEDQPCGTCHTLPGGP